MPAPVRPPKKSGSPSVAEPRLPVKTPMLAARHAPPPTPRMIPTTKAATLLGLRGLAGSGGDGVGSLVAGGAKIGVLDG